MQIMRPFYEYKMTKLVLSLAPENICMNAKCADTEIFFLTNLLRNSIEMHRDTP